MNIYIVQFGHQKKFNVNIVIQVGEIWIVPQYPKNRV